MISVLGPLELDGRGSLSPRDRVVFEALVVHAGRSVVPDRLADALWGKEPPPSWAKVVQGSIMRLRRTLGPTVIETTSDGYRLVVGGDDIDVMAFEHLVARARSLADLGDHERAVTTLEKALALWRGRPFGDLDGWEPAQAEAARLESMRRAAEEAMLDARLQSGDHLAAVAEGEALVSAEPLSERRWALLALALYRSGRQGDALRTVQRARRVLADELGVAPGPELVALEQRLLQQDPELVVTVAAPPHADARCPYRGLVPYDVDDDDSYFGRDREIETCLRRLASSSFLAVVGPSGCGKSSLVRAGVTSRLRRSGRGVAVLTPGHDPQGALVATMATADESTVLVVDQMEELFAPGLPAEAAEQFLAALVERLQLASVVVALRADHVGSLGVHPAFARRVEDGLHLVTSMTEDELRAAIEQPAAAAGLRLEPGLVELLLRDVSGEPGGLPLLSFALAETWANRDGRVLTVEGYVATGGLRQAIATAADRLYEGLPPGQRTLARALFLRLVTPTADGEAVRQRVDADAVITDEDHRRVVDAFVRTRLVVAGDDGLEVAHEALVREWPRLRSWLDEDQEGQRLLRHLATAAAGWEAMGRPETELYHGARLSTAQEWSTAHPHAVNPLETGFLTASASAHERQRRKARRTTRRLAVLLAVALIGAGLAAAQWHDATRQTARANAQARAAQAARLATLASTLQGTQLDVALLLGVEDHRLKPSASAEGALEAALAHTPAGLDEIVHLGSQASPNPGGVSPDGSLLAAPFPDGTVRVISLAANTVIRTLAGPAPALNAYFSRDNALVAVGSTVGTVTVFDVATGRAVGAPITPGGAVVFGEFDPTDSTRVLTISNNGDAVVWDRRDPENPHSLGAAFHFGYSVDNTFPPFASVSGDGRLLAATSDKNITYVWDIGTGRLLDQLPGGTGEFGPDNTTLVVSGDDGPQLWDARTGQPRGKPFGGASFAHALFSPDGHRLATADSTTPLVRVFDVDTHQLIGAPLALPIDGLPVRFLPDGRLVTTTVAGIYNMWRIGPTVGPLGVALVAGDSVRARFVRGGAAAVTIRDKKNAAETRLWDSSSGHPLGVLSAGTGAVVDVNPEGTIEAVADDDGTIALGDVATRARLGTLDGGRSGETHAVWAPTGTWIATTTSLQACRFNTGPCSDAKGRSADQTALIWNATDPHRPTLVARLVAPGTPPAGAASELFPVFSNDGRLVVVVDKVLSAVTVFDTLTGELRWTLQPGGQIIQAAFAPDDTTLAVVRLDASLSRVSIYEASDGTPAGGLDVANLDGAAFARSGDVIVTSSGLGDTTGMRLWDTATRQPIGDAVSSPGAFGMLVTPSPDGSKVITGTGFGTTVLWDLDTHHWEDNACRIAGRNLTKTEWRNYLPDQPYRRTCPQWPAGT